MKKSGYFIAMILAVMISLSFSPSQSSADQKIYKMGGEITAIDLGHNTVVVEVPSGEQLYTVSGPLSSKAVLKKGGQSVGLADFRRGDQVIVKWKVTEQGHVILELKSK